MSALPSHHYRDPMLVLEEKQAREQREKRRERPRMERCEAECWSPARKAAEALFDLPRPIREP
ncbi:hypothetical protein WI75_08625 [Burkholderia ubonensis]|nr:hypothetical protein WI75_08625 [Burkholderia ubonensis]